ncbi:cell division protein kinase 10, putative [Cryptosporidium muris RN66]|uniref:Cyclin-dependent kinase 2 homolog n=1 Tax=Cryptosporidium muris (strain RN66) TaxID=441375 RepID=B6AHM7_CRYMR|nr:cell division protein kinase 10, putative [Cryptosporidium muris RN66]EEA07722.1 cell division protein kinase 10, putative [Cryptosporidium muris RN66]|eukprot:XP_002142071.1 cell division protein kinase 10 [Cryptosporidium muris RN66]
MSKRYVQLNAHIGQGTYGKIEKARDTLDDSIVAIKKVKLTDIATDIKSSRQKIGQCGIHFTVLRELKIMNEIHHPNTMELRDVFVQGEFINVVMDYMESDLRRVFEDRIRFSEAQIKCILRQIVQGVAELHKWYILHRDLAPANIFINSKGIAKVGDFGLARSFGQPRREYTPEVVTLWYRSPELLLGATKYSDAVDMWSIGCIFAELLSGGKPLLPGEDELRQLGRIYELLGTPSDTNWPQSRNLPLYCEFTPRMPQQLKDIFPNASDSAIDLLRSLLKLNPLERISAKDTLNHEYFNNFPLPCDPSELPLMYLRES